MAWILTEKQEVIESLLDARQLAQSLEFFLRSQGRTQEADRVWEDNQRLQVEIDTLIGRTMDEWGKEAEAITATLNVAVDQLSEAIKKIKQKIQVAENVVKAIGLIDEILKILKPLFL